MVGEAAAREPIAVGTFCSGTDAPIFALRQAGIPHRHVFSAETNKHARTFIQANCPPETLYGDIMTLDLATVPRVDLFVAGPPCQPYSSLNPNRLKVSHTDDEAHIDPRISVLKRCVEYITLKKPGIAILENVVQLKKFWTMSESKKRKTDFEEAWDRFITPTIRQLHSLYDIHIDILNPRDFSCPQNRPRLYVVIKQTSPCRTFSFPQRLLPSTTFHHIIERNPSETKELIPWDKKVLRSYKSFAGVAWTDRIVGANVLGLNLCRSIVLPKYDYAHCLTTRSLSMVTHLGRYLTRTEMLRLQGFDYSDMNLLRDNITLNMFGVLIGNAMNVSVLVQVYRQIQKLEYRY